MSIEVQTVSKSYKHQKVLNQISFSAKTGEIIGFLGPNGAGKTTMMKILTGYIQPDQGEVFISKINMLEKSLEAKRHIGYLPEHNPLYHEMYVREFLAFQAGIYKIKATRIEEVINDVGLLSEAKKKIGQLSKGYQQRVGIAAAILHNPQVLILDEPTTGLDPNQLQEIRNLIKELGRDKTILFSEVSLLRLLFSEIVKKIGIIEINALIKRIVPEIQRGDTAHAFREDHSRFFSKI